MTGWSLFLAILLTVQSQTAKKPEWAEIKLNSGEVVSAKILDKNNKRVVIEIADQLLNVPMEQVARVTLEKNLTQSDNTITKGLYSLGEEHRIKNLEDQVQSTQGAVVSIETPSGLGSGFFISSQGHIVTNVHVVERETRIVVIQHQQVDGELRKKRLSNIRILALAPLYDLALLQAPESKTPYPFIPLSKGQNLQRGQMLYAIGNPLGLERTVSKGILSVLDRSFGGLRYLQTTVEVNPGNSGGPLFNMYGEVIGVINMKAIASEGLAFAIPVFYLKDFLDNNSAYLYDEKNANTGVQYNDAPFSVEIKK